MSGNRTTELLPCPICGGQPDFQHFNITPNVQGRIVCACGIELRQGKNDTEDDMRIIWNTRSDYAVQAANERKAEQAIAATLGSDNAFTREEVESAFVRGYSLGSLPVGSDPQWDENRQTVDEHMAELGWVRAATLGGGTLTAEQVREAVMSADRWEKPMGDTGLTNTHLIIRDDGWQEIADELNAELGRGMCKFEHVKSGPMYDVWRCSVCGYEYAESVSETSIVQNFCPSCGKAVE